eukprot:362355-Chlamydomonas_euryale.AAC.14
MGVGNEWQQSLALSGPTSFMRYKRVSLPEPTARSHAVPPRPRWRAHAWRACAVTWGPGCGRPTACVARC